MKKTLLSLGISIPAIFFSQHSANSSGGTISGSGGKIDYSVGQVFQSFKSSANFSISEGVHQPFEISTLGASETEEINLEIMVYPNPTIADITLKIGKISFDHINYSLYDQSGKLFFTKEIKSDKSLITMSPLNSGVYILVVSENSKILKTFKIIKK